MLLVRLFFTSQVVYNVHNKNVFIPFETLTVLQKGTLSLIFNRMAEWMNERMNGYIHMDTKKHKQNDWKKNYEEIYEARK